MLGRQHIILSVGTVLPFLIPLIFIDNSSLIQYGFVFLIAVFIGSLVPDADCKGKSALYYQFLFIDKLMRGIVVKITHLFFKIPKIKERIKEGYEVKEEHRGIMHSPVGILISSFILTIILIIILILINLFNFVFVIVILFGLFIGQFLHLLEDSTTISGINWKFPFGDKLIQGGIHTWNRNDLRPKIYAFILGAVSVLLVLIYSSGKINFSLFILYPLIFIVMVLIWVIFISISKISSKKDKTEGDELEAEAKKGEIRLRRQ